MSVGNGNTKTYPALDWHGIWPGYVSYDEDGLYFPQDLPRGLKLSVQPADQGEAVFSRRERWEKVDAHYPTIIREEDRFRMWYVAFADPEDPWVKQANLPGKLASLWCYAESEDGCNWERPNLGMFDFDGSTDNNILFAAGDSGCHYGYMNLMRDDRGDPQERYKAITIAGKFFVDGKPATREEVARLRAAREAAGDAGEIGANITSQMMILGGVSPDGIHWTHLEEPLMEPPWLLDTQNILQFDAAIGKYVIYLRSIHERRRAVSRYEADDFRGPWGNHHMVLTAEPDDPPDWDIYAPCYCPHPHGKHLMFFSPYRRASDLVDVYLAISHDGKLWYRPERTPIISTSDRYGSLYPTPELVELSDDRWGLMTMGCPHPHNRTNPSQPQEFFWATWKRDRLVAWEADDYAEFALSERECAGEQLRLNFKTHQPGAFVKVEIVDGSLPNRATAAEPPPLAGFSFDDCDPLSGDELDAVVSWKGKTDLSALGGKKIHLRFRMARTRLFAVDL